MKAQCLVSVPASSKTLLPSYATWFYAPSVIALQSAWLASCWVGSLMVTGWAPMLPAVEARKARGDPVSTQPREVIATPGSNVIRVMPAANANSVAPTMKVHHSSAEIIAFPRRGGETQP